MRNKLIFDHTEQGFVSGGIPKEIVKLTYEEVVNYHKEFYHPWNMVFVSTGNYNHLDHIEMLENEFLSKIKDKEIRETWFE